MTTPLDTSTPTASDYISNGDDKIREFKTAIIERLAVDHVMAANVTDYSAATNGEHAKITLNAPITSPTASGEKGFIYSKTVGTAPDDFSELHYICDAGHAIQITSHDMLKPTADASTIELDATVGLRLKDAGITGAKLSATLKGGASVEVDGDGHLEVKVPAAAGDVAKSFSAVTLMGRYTGTGAAKTITMVSGVTIRKVEILNSTGAVYAYGGIALRDATGTAVNANFGLTVNDTTFVLTAGSSLNILNQVYLWIVTGERS